MQLNWNKRRSFEAESFDMTPIIDVVFLLIIFFMLVCQFIAAEQFQVEVPDHISSAQKNETSRTQPLTITVMAAENEQSVCMVGSEKLRAVKGSDQAMLIQSAIDDFLSENKTSERTIRLRCDKTATFGDVKHILSGISNSQATDLEWAVLGE